MVDGSNGHISEAWHVLASVLTVAQEKKKLFAATTVVDGFDHVSHWWKGRSRKCDLVLIKLPKRRGMIGYKYDELRSRVIYLHDLSLRVPP